MRGAGEAVIPALERLMKKRKTPRMSQDKKSTGVHASDRRNKGERRADDRRAHARFEPGRSARTDRRQGERRDSR